MGRGAKLTGAVKRAAGRGLGQAVWWSARASGPPGLSPLCRHRHQWQGGRHLRLLAPLLAGLGSRPLALSWLLQSVEAPQELLPEA